MEEPIPTFGGFSEVRPATPDIQEIADKVKPKLEEKTNESYQEFTAIEYKSQVVSGTNYLIKVRVGDHSYVHIEVHEPLFERSKDGLVLFNYQTGKSKEDELD